MLRLSVFSALLCIASTEKDSFPNGKIVGGSPTLIEYHPYQVSIEYHGRHLCEGSLHKTNIVISAGRCFEEAINVGNLSVRVGSTNKGLGGQVFKVSAVKVHPEFNRTSNVNDIAVVNLIENVNITWDIRTMKLASLTPKTGTSAIVSGWGSKLEKDNFIETTQLLNVQVWIIEPEKCHSPKFKSPNLIDNSMLCAMEKSKKACIGNSGGPLITENRLVGIFSWNVSCNQTDPGVYTDVSKFHSWIDDIITSFKAN